MDPVNSLGHGDPIRGFCNSLSRALALPARQASGNAPDLSVLGGVGLLPRHQGHFVLATSQEVTGRSPMFGVLF